MRVLHLLPHVLEIGNGIGDVTVDLAIAQAAAGLDVHLASSGGELEELLTAEGVRCHRLNLVPADLPRAARLVRDLAPDVVHTHTVKGLLIARAVAGRRPVLTTAHRDFGRLNALLRCATRVVAVSEGISETLRRTVPARRVVVVRNGVLGGPRRARVLAQAEPLQLPHPSVVYVGGLYLRKGVDVLIEAVAGLVADGSLPGLSLQLVGAGPDGEELRALAERSGAGDAVTWAGFRTDAHRWMRAADVLVLPSRTETFGLVLAEARDLGVAIVASDVGGIPEVLDGGRAGRLFPVGDAAALQAHLRELLTDDDARAALAAAAGADLGWLGVHRMRQDMDEVYAAVLARR